MSAPLAAQFPWTRSARTLVPAAGGDEEEPPKSILANLQWSPAFVGFVAYIWAVTSYRAPIGTAAMLLGIAGLLFEREKRRVPPLVVGAVGLLIWAVIGYTMTEFPWVVMPRMQDFAKLCLIMFVAVNVLRTRARFRFFVILFLVFFALYPVRGTLFNYYVYQTRWLGRAMWTGVYSNSNDLATFCMLPLCLAVGLLATERQRWMRIAAAAGACVLPYLIILSQSRGGFIGLATFGVVVLSQQRRRLRKIMIVALVAAGLFVSAPDSALKRIGTVSAVTNTETLKEADDRGSAAQRYEIWRIAVAIIGDNPVIGVGLGAYSRVHARYARMPGFDRLSGGYRDTHSTYLNIIAETGFVGFGFFCFLVLATVIPAERIRRRAKVDFSRHAVQLFYLEVGLLGFLVAAIWGTYTVIVFTYLHLALIVAAGYLLKQDMRRLARTRAMPTRTQAPAAGALLPTGTMG